MPYTLRVPCNLSKGTITTDDGVDNGAFVPTHAALATGLRPALVILLPIVSAERNEALTATALFASEHHPRVARPET